MRTPLLTGTVLLVLAGTPGAQTAPVDVPVQAWADASDYLIGERIEVQVHLTTPLESNVVGPEVHAQHGPFEVLRVLTRDSKEGTGLVSHTWAIQLTTFESGRLTLPPFELGLTTGGVRQTILSPPIELTVHAPDVDAAGALRPIRPPMARPSSSSTWMWVAALLFVAGAAAVCTSYLGTRLKLRIRMGQAPVAPLDLESRLAALDRRLPATDAEIAAFYTNISNVVRECLQTAYGVPATTLSTRELVGSLPHRAHGTANGSAIERVLETLDRVKFAGWRPSDAQDHADILEQARSVVRASRS